MLPHNLLEHCSPRGNRGYPQRVVIARNMAGSIACTPAALVVRCTHNPLWSLARQWRRRAVVPLLLLVVVLVYIKLALNSFSWQ